MRNGACIRHTAAAAKPLLLLLLGLHLGLVPACDCGGGSELGTFAPELRLAPAEIHFDALPVGGSGRATVTLINDGSAPLVLEGEAGVDGPAAARFAIAGGLGGLPLASAAFTELSLSFAPLEEGTYEGELVLPFAAPVGEVRVPLRGEAVPAAVELSPAALDLGDVAVGEGATAEVQVQNHGEAALSFALVAEGDGFFLGGAKRLSLELEPGEARQTAVAFTPARGGLAEGRLIAEICGEGCGPEVSLRGTGLAPRIEATPDRVLLGEVPRGEQAEATVVVRNAGVGNLNVSSLRVVGGEGRVTLVDAPAVPLVLASGEERALSLRYDASVPEAELAADLLLESNDPHSPRARVPVRGTTPGAALRLLPAAAHFGVLDVGDERVLDVIAVSTGTSSVLLEALTLDGAGAFEVATPLPGLPLSLASGESLLLQVRAAPQPGHAAAGGAEGALVVDTAEDGSHEAALTFLSGTAGCQPRASVSALNLGALRVGLGTTGTLVVENIGDGSCTLESLAPADGLPFDPGFSWDELALEVIPPGGQGELRVGFTAASVGTSSAFFELRYAGSPAPLFVSATARGVLGSLVAEPPTVVFGSLAEGCPVAPGAVTFVNDGAGPVVVEDIYLDPPGAAFSLAVAGLPRTVPAGGILEAFVTPDTDDVGEFSAAVVAVTDVAGEVSAAVGSSVEADDSVLSETFTVDGTTQSVDILFIVDDSGSMLDDQQRLADNFASFIAAAGSAGSVDFHIGVTTTDVIFSDAAKGALLGSPAVLRHDTPGLEELFQERVQVGVDGHWVELGLEAMRLALSEPTLSGPNAGFLRPEAALSVVVVSDEDDSAFDPDLSQYYPEGVRSVAGYAAFLEGLKGGVLSNAPVLFSAVTGGGLRYAEMVDHFGGVRLQIGDSDWGTRLGEVGEATFGLNRSFQLSANPSPGTVTVTVNGEPVTDFELRSDTRTVVLEEPPPPGAVVEVSYRAECS